MTNRYIVTILTIAIFLFFVATYMEGLTIKKPITISIYLIVICLIWIAQSYANTTPVQLQITSGNINCFSSGFDLGITGTSFSAQIVSWWMDVNRGCADLAWTNNDPLLVIVGTPISNGITQIAPQDTAIRIIPTWHTHNCAWWVNFQTWYVALDTNIELMKKLVSSNICSYSGIPQLQAIVPAQATVGNYSGILTVTFPSP